MLCRHITSLLELHFITVFGLLNLLLKLSEWNLKIAHTLYLSLLIRLTS